MRASKRPMRIDANGMRDTGQGTTLHGTTGQAITGREGSGRPAPGEAVVRLMLGGSVRARPTVAVPHPIARADDSARIPPARPRGPARDRMGAGPSGVGIDARAGAVLAPPTRKTMR